MVSAHGSFYLFIVINSSKGAPPELSVKTGPPAPLCETAKSGFDFRVQECHTSMASMHHGGPGLGEAR